MGLGPDDDPLSGLLRILEQLVELHPTIRLHDVCFVLFFSTLAVFLCFICEFLSPVAFVADGK